MFTYCSCCGVLGDVRVYNNSHLCVACVGTTRVHLRHWLAGGDSPERLSLSELRDTLTAEQLSHEISRATVAVNHFPFGRIIGGGNMEELFIVCGAEYSHSDIVAESARVDANLIEVEHRGVFGMTLVVMEITTESYASFIYVEEETLRCVYEHIIYEG